MYSKNQCCKSLFILVSMMVLSLFPYDAARAEMINACVGKWTKNIRLVDSPGNCSRFENEVSWNNVPQEVLDTQAATLAEAQATIAELAELLTRLENEKVDPVSDRVARIEDDHIPAVTTRIIDVESGLNETDLRLTETGADVANIRDSLDGEEIGVIARLNVADAKLLEADDRLDAANAKIIVLEEKTLELDPEVEDSVAAKVIALDTTVSETDERVLALEEALPVEKLETVDNLYKHMKFRGIAEDGLMSTAAAGLADEDAIELPSIIFEGVNVYIQSGEGLTDDDGSGLGNLIIGYNELPEENADAIKEDRKTASHNLVIGPKHKYKSIGALVAGYENSVSGKYVTVAGGEKNTADGFAVSVSGGTQNTANNDCALVPFGELFEDPLPAEEPPDME